MDEVGGLSYIFVIVFRNPGKRLILMGTPAKAKVSALVLSREGGNDPKPSNWWFPFREFLGSFNHIPYLSHHLDSQVAALFSSLLLVFKG